MIKLFIIYGMDKEQSFELDSNTIYLGRSSENDIQIKDESISRKHLKIIKKSDTYFLEDLKSTNGTYIENKPIGSQNRRRDSLCYR